MTREEIADKLEELAKGIREGKTIQTYYTNWGDIKEHMLDDELRVENIRVKPEPKYIPFTIEDWKLLAEKRLKRKKDGKLYDFFWCSDRILAFELGRNLTCLGECIPCFWEQAKDEFVFADTGKPFAREVKDE